MSEFDQVLDAPESTSGEVVYGGFLLRFASAIIDGLILMIPIYGSMFLLLGSTMDFENPEAMEDPPIALFGLWYLFVMVAYWLYFALMESGKNQATFGKMAVGLKVTDMDGGRISFLKATGRLFGKIISGLILYIGYIMAAFTEKKQALHDIMASCLVVKK